MAPNRRLHRRRQSLGDIQDTMSPTTKGARWSVSESSDSHSSTTATGALESKSKLSRVESIGKKAKISAKRLLKVGSFREHSQEHSQEDDDGMLQQIEQNPAFSPNKMRNTESQSPAGSARHLAGKLNHVKYAVIHPKGAAKGMAASKLATSDEPFLSYRADSKLLNAHDDLRREETLRAEGADNEKRIGELERIIDEMEEEREMMKTAWTSSRFIRRARVVRPRAYSFPNLSDYRVRGPDGEVQRYDWPRWIGHLLRYINRDWAAPYIEGDEPPSFDQEITINHIERIIASSGPWQAWLLRLRSLNRWEDPQRTLKWLLAWLAIWYFDRVFTFLYGYVIYIVLKCKIRPQSREALKESRQRAIDSGSRAQKFGEMIMKHGKTKWLDPVIENIGPDLQIQLKDLADFLEVLNNFYNWKNGEATVSTLVFITIAIALGNFTTADFSMRILTFIIIFMFFVDRPISSRYPQYRHVVAPIRWIFWNIPTDSERSFEHLQLQAQRARMERDIAQKRITGNAKETLSSQQLETRPADPPQTSLSSNYHVESEPEEEPASASLSAEFGAFQGSMDLFAARGSWKGISGRLIVGEAGIRFVRAFPEEIAWQRTFDELEELRKTESTNAKIRRKNQLEVQFVDGCETLELKEKRDEAFNIIIAFSGLSWQNLQPRPGDQEKTERELTKRKAGVMTLS